MNNKRRRRKTVLDLNSPDESNLDATSSQTTCPKNTELFGNSLTHLLEQYNSDSDDDVPQTDKKQFLNDKVDDFFKEIQCITPKNDDTCGENKNEGSKSVWQECFDESTGYPYYWHIETNQVTWEIPKELELFRKNGGTTSTPGPSNDALRDNLSKNLNKQLPPGDKVPKDVIKRHKHKLETSAERLIKDKRKATNNLRDRDSDDGKIEMITSFGSDNTDSDRSDDNITSPEIQKIKIAKKSKYKSLKIGTTHSPQRPLSQATDEDLQNPANGNACQEEDSDTANNRIIGEKSQKIIDEHEKELKLNFSLVPGYADDSENEDNLTNKKRVIEPLFPIVSFDNSRSNERPSKIDTNIDESGCSQTFDTQETANNDDTRVPDKIEEIPKTNIFLEGLGTATKAFQRKKRIAFDVTMNKNKKTESESVRLQSDADLNVRGNDERHGLGFAKNSSDDADQVSNSSEDTSNIISLEKKETTTSKSVMGFVKGETLTLNQNQEPDKSTWTQDTQTIAEKLKFLSEGSSAASAVQVMNIQLQTLLTAWEAGDLKDRYFFNWLSSTNRELCRLEKAAAPPGWDCQWDQTQKRYYYRNEGNGETRWSYPDIAGGAEEMELCTTPPPPELDEKEKSPEPQIALNRETEIINHLGRTKDDNKQDLTTNLDQEKNENYTSNDKNDEVKVEQTIITEPKSPTPPPPPRICAKDLIRDRRKRRDAERHKSNTKNSKNDEVIENKACKENKEAEERDCTVNKNETILPEIEPTMSSAQIVNAHLLVPNSSHAEPLPPGVDQPEMPYAIAAASIEPPVIFSTAQQANASIYAATMSDPTNLSLLGHHHPLVGNQLVHYPAYHPHLQNQAIIAAANRLAGPDAVQFMLDYTRLYANTQVIAKPPVKMHNESLGTAIDSFYNDIASMESQLVIEDQHQANHSQATVLPVVQPHQSSASAQPEPQQLNNDSTSKDKKKKKVKIVISKKQKQVSSMVAKWKKAQNFEGTN